MNYTEIAHFRTTPEQKQALKKMKSFKINVSRFVREAVAEKLKNEYPEMLPKQKLVNYSPAALNAIQQLKALKQSNK